MRKSRAAANAKSKKNKATPAKATPPAAQAAAPQDPGASLVEQDPGASAPQDPGASSAESSAPVEEPQSQAQPEKQAAPRKRPAKRPHHVPGDTRRDLVHAAISERSGSESNRFMERVQAEESLHG